MIGVEGAAALAALRLSESLPAKLAELRTRYGATVDELPDPALVLPREAIDLRIEDYPAVMVIPQEMLGLVRSDVAEGGESFIARYNLRIYLWARGDHAQATDLARKRLTLAAREVLLTRGFLSPDATTDPTSLAESYSDIGVDRDNAATIAAAYITVDVLIEEDLRPGPGDPDAPIGVAASVTATIHPALMEEAL
jgi:hypothetical protein